MISWNLDRENTVSDSAIGEDRTAKEKTAKEKTLFRAAATVAIRNSHDAIKACWAILFTGGTFALINSVDHILECKLSGGATISGFSCAELGYPLDGAYFWLIYPGLVVVYVLTFYRFYVGNIRVFDIRYDEVFEFIDNSTGEMPDEKAKDREFDWLLEYNAQSWRGENLFLVFKTLVIIYLTIAITKPFKFVAIYAILLMMDIFWIVVGWIFSRIPKSREDEPQLQFRNKFFSSFDKLRELTQWKLVEKDVKKIIRDLEISFPKSAMIRWGWNNFTFLLILLAIPRVVNEQGVQIWLHKLAPKIWDATIPITPNLVDKFLVAGLVAMLSNCVVDLFLTWKFYNPRFMKLNRYLFGNP
jgi:hypothetical protein